ncbi:tRNA (guanine-N(7)-)-methyltransferase (tRNA(m7G46)-methyltransferase), partial [Kickxella alabastrina]
TRIPRLQFASKLPRALLTSILPSEYTKDTWEPPTVRELQQGSPQLAQGVRVVLDLVVRDFVSKWFGEISADPGFARCVLAQISAALGCLTERVMGAVDLAEFIVGGALPLFTAHLKGEGAHPALSGSTTDSQAEGSGGEDSEEAVKRRVMAHIRRTVDLVLPLVLPAEQLYAPHRVIVRELMTGSLLTPILMMLADPDTLNQLVDGQLEKMIREQDMVNELRGVLDQQQPITHGSEGDPADAQDDNMRSYEEFMAVIDRCQDVFELERISEDILAQIRKRRILIMGQNKDDIVHGMRVGDIIVYINRLYVAKKKAERRIQMLSTGSALQPAQPARPPVSAPLLPLPLPLQIPSVPGSLSRRTGGGSRVSAYYEHRDDPTKLGPPQFTLREILTNSSSLSAFAEYMDLIGCRFLLEFWINVEGVRHPLPALLPRIIASLWKTYFTLRVDELVAATTAGTGGDLVGEAISRVQRFLKPRRRAQGEVDLDLDGLTAQVCWEALGLIYSVQEA